MKRYALLLVCLAGCTAIAPVPGDSPQVTAELACEGSLAIVGARLKFVPQPPAPASKRCENCGGTGKLGDGRVVYDCPRCRGTGKLCIGGTCR